MACAALTAVLASPPRQSHHRRATDTRRRDVMGCALTEVGAGTHGSCALLLEHHRLVAVQEDPILQVPAYGAGQNVAFYITAFAH